MAQPDAVDRPVRDNQNPMAEMRGGKPLTAAAGTLETVRHKVAEQLGRLPKALKSLEPGAAYPVSFSTGLQKLADDLDRG